MLILYWISEIYKNTVKLWCPTQNMMMFDIYNFTCLLMNGFLAS